MISSGQFQKVIMDYYRESGRHDLLWRNTSDPYRILVSEVMLQQTQVSRVEGYYEKFIKEFPDFASLAAATKEDVLRAWQGLGYNRRALFLRAAAQAVMDGHNGALPHGRAALQALPGIGKGTSGSLMAFAWNKPEVFIETNIRRVFIHFFFKQKEKVTDAEIERCIKRTLPLRNPRVWYWALMDYGAMLGRAGARVELGKNPNLRSAHYKKQSKFAGSERELRGKVLRLLLARKKITIEGLKGVLGESDERVETVLESLSTEGFIARKDKFFCIN